MNFSDSIWVLILPIWLVEVEIGFVSSWSAYGQHRYSWTQLTHQKALFQIGISPPHWGYGVENEVTVQSYITTVTYG